MEPMSVFVPTQSNAEPSEAPGQISFCVVDLEHTPSLSGCSGVRRVEDRRRVGPDIAAIGQACEDSGALDRLGNPLDRDASVATRAERDEQWRIERVNRVEMDADRDHPFDHAERRFGMWHPLLDCPRPKTGRIASMTYRDSSI